MEAAVHHAGASTLGQLPVRRAPNDHARPDKSREPLLVAGWSRVASGDALYDGTGVPLQVIRRTAPCVAD
jgi:hypothetical protein